MEIMTKLVQCSCGNYYNAANHASCPICGAGANGQSQNDPGFGATVAPNANGGFEPAAEPRQPLAFGSFGATVAPNMSKQGGGAPINVTQPVVNDYKAAGNANPGFAPTETIYSAEKSGSLERTAMQPVVGWLVCIDGPMRGNDYRIHAGYNSIGREIGDIHIRGDQTISRQNHARIAFEPKSNRFFFSPADGRNIVYVNDQMVMNTEELRNYDVITIGETKLMLIALCGERFCWNG